MRTKKVVVVPYNPAWPEEFQKVRAEIGAALGTVALAIEHVGSTSVEGLWAKPILDVDVVIPDMEAFPEAAQRLAAIGYCHEGDLGIAGREAFCYAGKPHLMLHHLYVCPADSPELRRHTRFRDYLREHPEAVEAYGRVKREAAALYPEDIDGYLDYKGTLIQELYRACGLICML